MRVSHIAEVCHEANRAYCRALSDFSQPAWMDAPQWQRDSAIKGVEFHLANPGSSGVVAHQEWMKVKVAEGWTYGPVKDPSAKQHPCLVEYDALPVEQRLKDTLFIAVVDAFRAHVTE